MENIYKNSIEYRVYSIEYRVKTKTRENSLEYIVYKKRNSYNGIATEELEMKKIHLPIIIEIDEDGYYIVTCPIFKGCHSYGETIDEALKNIKEVIEMCLEETKVEELNKFVGFRELEVKQNA
jgi:predicted RNase H-like HicB family nuclease